MRIFIHNVDSYVGRALVKELRKSDGGLNRIFGTAINVANAPSSVKRIVSRDDPKKAQKMSETIESCKLVILDLHSASVEDLHFAIQSLKVDFRAVPPKSTGELESDVIFVLISSLGVWQQTEVTAADGYLRDVDFPRRSPGSDSKYQQWKECEDLALASFNREGGSQVKAFVVSAGCLYGEGEDFFKPMFELAWRGMQKHVSADPGTNRIPTVHVRDMARLVRQLSLSADGINPLEATPFFIAVDQPPVPPEVPPEAPAQSEEADAPLEDQDPDAPPGETPPAEVSAEAPPPGDDPEGGEPPAVAEVVRKPKPSTQAELVQGIVNEVCEPFEVPTWMAPDVINSSSERGMPWNHDILQDLVVEPSVMMQDPEFAASCEPPGWISRDGLVARVRTIAQEFCLHHQLRPMRVFIGGPPSSGKSTLAKAVAEHFKIPHLTLNPERLGDMLQMLSSNVCRYRGYVLDAGTVGFDEVDQLFRTDVEVPPDEDAPPPDPEEPPPPKKFTRELVQELCPQFIVVTQAPEALCRARSKATAAGNSFGERMQHYTTLNLTEGVPSLAEFFQMIAGIDVLNLPIAGKDEEDMFESVRIYMERAGRPFNFLPAEREVAAEKRALRARQQELKKASELASHGDVDQAEIEALDESRLHEHRLRVIAEHVREADGLKELSLRQYLLQYMVPTLTEGLIEVCKVMPENPVDYLANYLEEHAVEHHEHHDALLATAAAKN